MHPYFTPMQIAVLTAASAVLIGLVYLTVRVNITRFRQRRLMTRKERRTEDAEEQHEMTLW